jgi:hypothetical protein
MRTVSGTVLATLVGGCLVGMAARDAVAAAEAPAWPLSSRIDGPLVTNEWTRVEVNGTARRGNGALLWLPGEKTFLMALGAYGAWNDRGPFPYDELTFDLDTRVWKNRFPPGTSWKPEIGACDAPGIPYMCIKDGRLGLREAGFGAFFQYAVDTDRNRLVALANAPRGAAGPDCLLEYDSVSRQWTNAWSGAIGAPRRHSLMWGALCYDAHNKELMLFGGNNGPSEFNDLRTWTFSPETKEWKRIDTASEAAKALEARAEALRLAAVKLHGAYCNRYFKSELPEDGKAALADSAKTLAAGIAALKKDLDGRGEGYARVQYARAAADLGAGLELAGKLGDEAVTGTVSSALALTRVLWGARVALMSEPPPRAWSQMVYDPATKRIVLFGGDRLDMLYGDTWVYDCATRTWQERRPKTAPSPRAGHAFLRLPDSGKLVLLGGYGFASDTGYWGALYRQLPMQAWTYDVAGDQWTLVRDWGKPYPGFMGSKGQGFVAAAGAGDVILTVGSERVGERNTSVSLACKFDPAAPVGTASGTPASDAGMWRSGPYDPNWYLAAPTPDEAAFQAMLQAMAPNTWTRLTGKDTRLPCQNRDWGTAVYDPDRQAIYRWSGGHSAHCGSDIPVFSMRTGAYHLKYPPAFPLGGIGSCGSQPSRATFMGQPWISAHSYHSYAYDPVSRRMLCCGHESFSFVYAPESGLWSHKVQPKGMSEDCYYTLTLCSARGGACAWTRFGTLFRYDGAKDEWAGLTLAGEKLPGTQCDGSGMCYDARRDRLLLFDNTLKGDVVAVDLKTLTAAKLGPKGMAGAAAGGIFVRECVYDASCDAVVPAVGAKDKPWPVYDCAKNAWVAVKVADSPGFGCSNGFMYDPARNLVLAVGADSVVYAMRLDTRAAAELAEPGKAP